MHKANIDAIRAVNISNLGCSSYASKNRTWGKKGIFFLILCLFLLMFLIYKSCFIHTEYAYLTEYRKNNIQIIIPINIIPISLLFISIISIPSPKIGWVERDFVVELWFPWPTSTPQEAHNGHFSTFTTDTEQRFQNKFASDEPDHPGNDCDDRTSNDAWIVPLDRERWELPDSATVLPHAH